MTNKLKEFTTLAEYSSLATKCLGHKLVGPISMRPARVAIVGESLGREEDLKGEYFIGPAGKLLDKLLREAGLVREVCHITNLVKIQPPGNDMKRLKEYGLSVDDFIPLLKEELNEIKPTVVIPLGNYALKALTGEFGITKWRGSEIPCTIFSAARCFPTLHPSYIQRGQWSLYPFVRSDLKTAGEAAFGLTSGPRKFKAILDPTLEESLVYIERCKNAKSTVVDIETAHKRIRAIGLSCSETDGISIPLRYKGFRNRWNYTEFCILLRSLRSWYESPGVKIAHNAEYDFLWLYPLIGMPKHPIFCTMRAHALVYPEAPHDLGFIMSTHTRMPFHKDERKSGEGDENLWLYNVKDCVGTLRIYEKLVQELVEISMWEFFCGYTMPFFRLTLEMERVGIRVDREEFERKKVLVTKKAYWLERAITKAVGRDVNVNSPKQIASLLYDDWSLPKQRHRVTGKITTDRTALEFLYARYPNKVFKMIMTQRHLTAKILGTYLSDKIIGEDGHAHTSFGVTVTGRLSSRESDVFYSGTDLQNQPKTIRDMFLPDVGQRFMSVDLANAENRVQALVAGMSRAIEAFQRGENVHLKVGEWVFGRRIDKRREPDVYRALKAIQHGTNYGMGERTFATHIKKSVAEGKVLRAKYLEWVPELEAWHKWVMARVTSGSRSLTTPMGRKRTFTKLPSDHKLRNEAFAHIPQSTVADVINIGGLGLWLCLPPACRMTLQIHDEWLISYPPEQLGLLTRMAHTHLEDLREIRWEGRVLKVPIEIEDGKINWRR